MNDEKHIQMQRIFAFLYKTSFSISQHEVGEPCLDFMQEQKSRKYRRSIGNVVLLLRNDGHCKKVFGVEGESMDSSSSNVTKEYLILVSKQ